MMFNVFSRGAHMHLYRLWIAVWLIGLVPLVTGCDMGTEQVPNCAYISGNVLADPQFSALDASSKERFWRYSQHAKNISFSYDATDGTLTFIKTGAEPWALLSQALDAEALQGKRVEFSANLKLDLSEPNDAHVLGYGGGLALLGRQVDENGSKIRLSSSLKHEPRMGNHDWQRVTVVEDVPKRISHLYAGFLHRAGGTIQVRDPALRVVTAGCELTVIGE